MIREWLNDIYTFKGSKSIIALSSKIELSGFPKISMPEQTKIRGFL